MNIDPSIFNKQEARTEDLHLHLSEKYMVYKDYAERCMLNPQHIGKKPKSVTALNLRQGGQQSLLHPSRNYFLGRATDPKSVQKRLYPVDISTPCSRAFHTIGWWSSVAGQRRLQRQEFSNRCASADGAVLQAQAVQAIAQEAQVPSEVVSSCLDLRARRQSQS